MKGAPRFSVIVSTLNEEKVVEATLTAIRAQNNQDFELIVADGGSTDRTIEIARRFTDQVLSSPDVNLGAGRNKGARATKGSILVFVDADTRLPPETLDTIDSRIASGSVGGSFSVEWWDGDTTLDFIAGLGNLFMLLWETSHGAAGYGPCMFFERRAFEHAGGYSERIFFEDMDIARRLLASTGRRVAFVLEHPVYSSSRRFRRLGFFRYAARNAHLFFLRDLLGRRPKSYHGQYDMTVR